MKTQIEYGLINKRTGNQAYINIEENKDRYACGTYTYQLVDKPMLGDRVWKTEDIEVAQTLKDTSFDNNIGWYNSLYNRPVIASELIENMEVVKITTTIEKVD